MGHSITEAIIGAASRLGLPTCPRGGRMELADRNRLVQHCVVLVTVLVLGAMPAVGTSGCGEVDEPNPAQIERLVPADGPVNVEILVDGTASTASEVRRESFVEVGNHAMSAVIDRGGIFAIRVFAADIHSAELLSGEISTSTPGADKLSRAQEVNPIRDSSENALAQGLAIVPPTPEVAARLRALSRGGSDIAGNVGIAVRDIAGLPTAVVTVATDGLDARLHGHLDETPDQLASRLDAALPRVSEPVSVALVGIGGSAKAQSTPDTERLIRAWQIACEDMGPRVRCFVAAATDLDRFID